MTGSPVFRLLTLDSLTPQLVVRDSHLHFAKACRGCAVAGSHGLHGLALAAVRHAPQRPVLGAADGVAGIPEFCGNAAVARVLQHARLLAGANLPANFGPELEVIAPVVDRPATVGLHVDAVI